MKLKPLLPLFILTFVLCLLGCGQSSVERIKPTETAVTSETCGVLVEAEGDVECQRKGSPEYQRVFFGAVLHCDSLLWVGKEANATVLCNDLTRWPVPPGVSGLNNRCPSAQEAVQIHNGSKIANTRRPNEPLISFQIPDTPKIRNTRSGNDPSIPKIISPRATHLLNNQGFLLRWQAVPGATNYTVRVINSSGEVKFKTETSDTQVIYSGEPLEEGESYLLIVESDNGHSSSDESAPGLEFKLLNKDEEEKVRQLEMQIAELKLPEEAKALTLADLYAHYDLIAKAIELLEAQDPSDPSQKAAVELKQGHLYRLLGLNRLAQKHYSDAAPLAEAVGDIMKLAAAQVGLVKSYAALGNLPKESQVAEQLAETYVVEGKMDEAIDSLNHARTICEDLADEQCVHRLDKRLTELSK